MSLILVHFFPNFYKTKERIHRNVSTIKIYIGYSSRYVIIMMGQQFYKFYFIFQVSH